jgi:hypothetical protein
MRRKIRAVSRNIIYPRRRIRPCSASIAADLYVYGFVRKCLPATERAIYHLVLRVEIQVNEIRPLVIRSADGLLVLTRARRPVRGTP